MKINLFTIQGVNSSQHNSQVTKILIDCSIPLKHKLKQTSKVRVFVLFFINPNNLKLILIHLKKTMKIEKKKQIKRLVCACNSSFPFKQPLFTRHKVLGTFL